jgi:DNA-binding MarR family transcriptional regulator
MDIRNAAFFFTAYRKLIRAYTDFIMGALKDYELSPNEIVVLSSLETTNTASEIALNSDVSKALVSRSVKLLKEKGFITALISDFDKREQTLSLTDAGRVVAKLIEEANRQFFTQAFADFEENERKVLKALLMMMLNNLNIGVADNGR